jgi:hypothetical protein
MKKIFLLVLLISFSTILYCQSDSITYITIKNQLDSLIIKNNVRTIDVSSANGVNVGPSADFKILNGFLIVKKSYYFNLNKIVSFYIGKRNNGTNYLSIVFN